MTTKQNVAEEVCPMMMILKTTMTPHGEEIAVTPHLLATRGLCLRNKITDPIGTIPCLHLRRYNTDLRTKFNSIGETTLELDSHADVCFRLQCLNLS
jgi:hypothetical protein